MYDGCSYVIAIIVIIFLSIACLAAFATYKLRTVLMMAMRSPDEEKNSGDVVRNVDVGWAPGESRSDLGRYDTAA